MTKQRPTQLPVNLESMSALVLESDDEAIIHVDYENNAFYGIQLNRGSSHIAQGNYLYVEEESRGRAIGEALVRRAVEIATELGAVQGESYVQSQYSLDIAGRVFGKEALRYYHLLEPETDDTPAVFVELPMSFDQARQSLVRAEGFENDRGHRDIGFEVRTYLTTIPVKTEQ